MIEERRSVGKRGEQQACEFLQKHGHVILHRNWRAGHKEIDIISIKDGAVHIVEVKSKTAPVMASPVLNVNLRKQKNLVAAAGAFLNSKGRKDLPQDLEVVFDVISIIFYEDHFSLEYYPQAYIPTYV